MPSSGLRNGKQPRTTEAIIEDFINRRSGLLKALTMELDDLYDQCDPDSENLCLYGNDDGSWSVDLPADEVPAELPEPTLGINFARDGMTKEEWAFLVAVHCDCWLMSVAFYYAFRLDAAARARIHKGINALPTLYEVVHTEFENQTHRSKRKRDTRLPMSSSTRNPNGKLLNYKDISPALKGHQAELYWPDDDKWYLVEIHGISSRQRSAKIQYASGEYEELDLDEIIQEGHMSLLP